MVFYLFFTWLLSGRKTKPSLNAIRGLSIFPPERSWQEKFRPSCRKITRKCSWQNWWLIQNFSGEFNISKILTAALPRKLLTKPHQLAKLKDPHIKTSLFWSWECFLFDTRRHAAPRISCWHFSFSPCQLKLEWTWWLIFQAHYGSWAGDDDVGQPAGSSLRGGSYTKISMSVRLFSLWRTFRIHLIMFSRNGEMQNLGHDDNVTFNNDKCISPAIKYGIYLSIKSPTQCY